MSTITDVSVDAPLYEKRLREIFGFVAGVASFGWMYSLSDLPWNPIVIFLFGVWLFLPSLIAGMLAAGAASMLCDLIPGHAARREALRVARETWQANFRYRRERSEEWLREVRRLARSDTSILREATELLRKGESTLNTLWVLGMEESPLPPQEVVQVRRRDVVKLIAADAQSAARRRGTHTAVRCY